ncbi:MAG: hypothetical protein ACLSH0_00765 [Mediterraneibacter faecis]
MNPSISPMGNGCKLCAGCTGCMFCGPSAIVCSGCSRLCWSFLSNKS